MVFDAIFQTFAATESSDSGVLGVLGIDWVMLAFQLIAFLILVGVLSRFVYPVFMKVIDERQAAIDASLEAAREAESSAETAQKKIDKQLAEARKEARDIVATAKDEANQMLSKADEKAKASAQLIVNKAHQEIDKEVIAAKRALHNETLDLVASATERVIGKTHSKSADKSVISDALKEAEK